MTQRVLVTAGAAGIGRAIAKAFVAQGAKVHVCDIDAEALAALRVDVPVITTSVCDVGDRAAVEAMVAQAAAALAGLDVLINNAGIAGPTASVEQERAAGLANQSLERFVVPEDIGTLAVFLASPAARSMSGQIVPIDGDSQTSS